MKCGKDSLSASLIVMALALMSLAASRQLSAQQVPARAASSRSTGGLAAMQAAAEQGKYLFVFFWKSNDQQTRSMHGVFQAAMSQWTNMADSIEINISDAREKTLVDKFAVSRAPMPLVLALAPNGAVTKGFPRNFDEKKLRDAFVSVGTAKCLKALQNRKMVLLCVQNEQSRFAQAAMDGALGFQADPRYAKSTEIVVLHPEDPNEAAFLHELQIDPHTPQAMTVLLAPPGQVVAKFAGAVTPGQLVSKLSAAQSSCCPGGKCGPGGCGPKK